MVSGQITCTSQMKFQLTAQPNDAITLTSIKNSNVSIDLRFDLVVCPIKFYLDL